MTTHSDRDRSERPWWPPAAPEAYADEPVPFVLTDEPQGEHVRRFPLDEGDPGSALLPVVPEGILLRCIMCPETLADTAGGWLVHHDDGSHTFEPSSAPARNPLHGMPATGDAADTVADDVIRAWDEGYRFGRLQQFDADHISAPKWPTHNGRASLARNLDYAMGSCHDNPYRATMDDTADPEVGS